MQIPEDKDISFLTSKCSGTELETAILFAATLGLRRSEICALTWDDINFEAETVRIDKAVVLDHEKEWVGKGTKTYSSTRTLDLSSILIEHLAKLPRKGDRILSVNPDALTNRFCRLRSQCGFSFRFHDLRHYNASVMLAEGIPDKYAMGQLGHATPNMLQNVYQHLMQGKKSETAITLNNYMDAAFGKKDADATPLPDHT